MTAKEIIKEACKSAGKTQKEAAIAIGLTNKQLCDLLSRGALKASKFLEMLNEIGVRVTFVGKETGREIPTNVKWIGKADEFLELLNAVGVEVIFTSDATGRQLSAPRIRGDGRRVRQMVNGVIYDTNDSDALANSFYVDGVHEYNDSKACELYIDRRGRYFIVEYCSRDGEKDKIIPCTASEAANFVENYGTELHRQPQQN